MQLRLEHNHTGLTYDSEPVWVNIETKEGKLTKELIGYVENNETQEMLRDGAERCKISCRGWRLDEMDNWTYIIGEQYIVGIIYNDLLFARIVNNKPVFKLPSFV